MRWTLVILLALCGCRWTPSVQPTPTPAPSPFPTPMPIEIRYLPAESFPIYVDELGPMMGAVQQRTDGTMTVQVYEPVHTGGRIKFLPMDEYR